VEQQEMPRPIDTRPGHAFQRLTAPPVFDPVVNPTTGRPSIVAGSRGGNTPAGTLTTPALPTPGSNGMTGPRKRLREESPATMHAARRNRTDIGLPSVSSIRTAKRRSEYQVAPALSYPTTAQATVATTTDNAYPACQPTADGNAHFGPFQNDEDDEETRPARSVSPGHYDEDVERLLTPSTSDEPEPLLDAVVCYPADCIYGTDDELCGLSVPVPAVPFGRL
jgi:hypothetical protein